LGPDNTKYSKGRTWRENEVGGIAEVVEGGIWELHMGHGIAFGGVSGVSFIVHIEWRLYFQKKKLPQASSGLY
jgi:hypothetical protein